MASIIVAIVLTLSAAGGSTAYASQASLPGDTLYSLKLGTEQMRMMLPGNDVVRAERALSFAERRMEEMQALAEKERLQHLDLAVEGYEDAMAMVMTRLERASREGLTTGNVTVLVAEATAKHLSVLDKICDMVPGEAPGAIAHARQVSETGRENALAALAKNNPGGATEINLAAMNGRLNRAMAAAERNDAEEVENTLGQFEDMIRFGAEIASIAQKLDKDEAAGVGKLVAVATSGHLFVLDEVYDKTPDQAKLAVTRARETSINSFGEGLIILAQTNPMRAMEINGVAMGERLKRVRAGAEAQDEAVETVEDALQQFKAMAEFGEEITRIAQEVGINITMVEDLVAEATSKYLDVLADVWGGVPEQAKPAIEQAMANLLISHQKKIQALKKIGMETPPVSGIQPGLLRDRVEARIRQEEIRRLREEILRATGSAGISGGMACPSCRRN